MIPKLELLCFESTNRSSYYEIGDGFLDNPLSVSQWKLSSLITFCCKGSDEMEHTSQILMAANDLKILKITVESRLPAKKKAQIQQNVRQMQRISENCQIFFEEERFDELDFFGIHRVFRRQRILTITFFCNYSSVDVTNCTTILFIYFLIGCAALSFYGINLTNDFFYSILLFKELFLFGFLIF